MALGQKLQMRQGQSLVMTPQLQQAIKLLQLSNLELSDFVESELESNPLLSRDDNNEDRPDARDEPRDPSRDQSTNETDRDTDTPAGETRLEELSMREDGQSAKADAAMDADYESLDPESGPSEAAHVGGAMDWSRANSGRGGFSDGGSLLETATTGQTLAEHLADQLAMAARDPADRLIGVALLDLVDEDGYLRADTTEIATRLGADMERIDEVVALIQTFEPTGVGARDLKECLALQLKERDRFDPAMEALVANLELLAKYDYKKLKALCGVDEADLNDMVAELKALSPKPGFSFGGETAATVQPDVYVREKPGGGWAVELN